ncbi:MAG: hypothetical protein PHC34_02710 [Candidatus Gastranaerophilales bacterium]|nr:hypothetical protein [Candidatus Gastranaerophilales bacterium]
MKIFHGLKSWNFQAESLAKAENMLDLDSQTFLYKDIARNPLIIFKIIKDFNVFNFYTNYTFLPISTRWHFWFVIFGGLDLYLLKALGKKILLHYQGCDIKNRFNDPAPNVCKYCASPELEQICTPKLVTQRRKKILKLMDLADEICVTTPDLYEYIDLNSYKVNWIPKINYNKIALKSRKYSGFSTQNKMKIVHAPSKRSKKGTEVILEVVEKHKDKFELILIENKTRQEVLEIANEADIAIDQLRIGWYGNYSVEMMSLGLPTIAYISEDAIKHTGDDFSLPIINSSADNIENVLLNLYKNPLILEKASSSSIEFIKTFHSPESIGNRMLEIYKRINTK